MNESLPDRRADQRTRLLGAAKDVIAREGYRNATVEEIVAAANVPPGAFEREFGGKEPLMLAAYRETLDGLVAAILAAATAAHEPADAVRAGLRALLAGLAADPAGARLVLVEAAAVSPALDRARMESRANIAGLIARELGRIPGWDHHDAAEREIVALTTMAAVAAPVSQLAAKGELANWEEAAEELTDYALRALTPSQAQPRPRG